jgi:hypothetical protein
VTLNLTHRHAPCVQRQYLVVKAAPAGLVLGDDLRLERASAVAGDFNGQFTKVAFEGFLAASVAGVAGLVGHQFILAMTQVVSHFGLQRAFNQGFGELLEDAVLANQVFRFLVVRQQASISSVGNGFISTVIIAPCKTAVSCQKTVYTKLLTPPPSLSGWVHYQQGRCQMASRS